MGSVTLLMIHVVLTFWRNERGNILIKVFGKELMMTGYMVVKFHLKRTWIDFAFYGSWVTTPQWSKEETWLWLCVEKGVGGETGLERTE